MSKLFLQSAVILGIAASTSVFFTWRWAGGMKVKVDWQQKRLPILEEEAGKTQLKHQLRPQFKRLNNYNCEWIMQGRRAEIRKAERFLRIMKPDSAFVATDCDDLVYSNYPATNEEKQFPIAYTILAYKNFEQLLRLLRFLYRPWHFFCIHVDAKVRGAFRDSVQHLMKCLPNIIEPESETIVNWGGISVVKAALSCLNALQRFDDWKYVLNIAATDFPLKTNAEIFAHLKSLNGASDVQVLNKTVEWRYKYKFSDGIVFDKLKSAINMSDPTKWKDPPPREFHIRQGSFSAALARDFVKYMLINETSHRLLNWLNDTFIPDELFWPTLYYEYECRNSRISK